MKMYPDMAIKLFLSVGERSENDWVSAHKSLSTGVVPKLLYFQYILQVFSYHGGKTVIYSL